MSVLTTLRDSVFLLIVQPESMEWQPSIVTRTRIRVIGVIFNDVLIKGEEIWFELAGNSSYPSSSLSSKND